MWRWGGGRLRPPGGLAPQRANCNHMEVRPSALVPGSAKDLPPSRGFREGSARSLHSCYRGVCDLRSPCISFSRVRLRRTRYTPGAMPGIGTHPLVLGEILRGGPSSPSLQVGKLSSRVQVFSNLKSE